MRVLAYVHKYPPAHNAGAEFTLHHLLRHLQGLGHEVRVLSRDQTGADGYQGVPVRSRVNTRAVHEAFSWCTVAVTHLDVTRFAVQLALRHRKPLVHLTHNHRQLAYHRVTPVLGRAAALVVHNSRWLAEMIAWPGAWCVLHPPVPPEAYRAEGPHDRVLFSNLTAAKGAPLVYALAAALPRVPFLLVRGAYGYQLEPPELPNVEVVAHRPDFAAHLARASVVLMPSAYESWGRVAVEAGCAGVPAVLSTAPGLVESMGPASVVVPVVSTPDGSVVAGREVEGVSGGPESVAAWSRALVSMLADRERAGARARRRAEELWGVTQGQLVEVEARMAAL